MIDFFLRRVYDRGRHAVNESRSYLGFGPWPVLWDALVCSGELLSLVWVHHGNVGDHALKPSREVGVSRAIL